MWPSVIFADTQGVINGILIFFAVMLILFGFIFFVNFGRLYIQAYSSGCKTPIKDFVGMWLRKVKPKVIVESLIMAHKAGLTEVQNDKLEAHYMARGNVKRVVTSLVVVSKAGIHE